MGASLVSIEWNYHSKFRMNQKYSCLPDYPWEEDNESAVFRHKVSKKWFALLMNISADKIGKNSTEKIWVVNLKADKWNISDLKMEQGIYTAYHMNKVHWITVNLAEASSQYT